MTDLERTYREESPRLLNWIRSRLGSRDDAEDLLQDVFTRAATALDAARPVDNLVSWLYASARNAVVDTWRSRDRREASVDPADLATTPESLVAESVEPGPHGAYLKTLAMEALEDAIGDLPRAQREVFLLQAVDGYTFAETAELLDISINTAMSRKRYAVAKLRERLGDFHDVLQHEEESYVR